MFGLGYQIFLGLVLGAQGSNSVPWYDNSGSMRVSRILVLAGAAALVAAWLSSAAATKESAIASGRPNELTEASPAQSDPSIAAQQELESQLARLSEQAGQAPHLPLPARNPFILAKRGSGKSVGEVVGSPPTTARAVVASDSARLPSLSLAGIAVERTSAGQMWTAILSADNRVLLARVGDIVLGRYEVRLVDVDSVDLFDRQQESSLRLTMP